MRASTPTPLPSFQALARKITDIRMHPRPAASRPPSRHPAVQLPSAFTSPPEPLFSRDSETPADMYIGANTATVPYPFSQQPASAIASCPLLLSIGWACQPALQPFSLGRESVVFRDRAGREVCQHMMTPPRPHYRRTSMDTDGYTRLLAITWQRRPGPSLITHIASRLLIRPTQHRKNPMHVCLVNTQRSGKRALRIVTGRDTRKMGRG
jgi:hypothetical protein